MQGPVNNISGYGLFKKQAVMFIITAYPEGMIFHLKFYLGSIQKDYGCGSNL
jgi:hypothetical protein